MTNNIHILFTIEYRLIQFGTKPPSPFSTFTFKTHTLSPFSLNTSQEENTYQNGKSILKRIRSIGHGNWDHATSTKRGRYLDSNLSKSGLDNYTAKRSNHTLLEEVS